MIEKLRKLLSECFDKEGKLRIDCLMDKLGEHISKDVYELTWLGKRYAKAMVFQKPTTMLKPIRTPNSGNVLIKSDNLEALKHLVYAYENQIKMIYIDPA